MLTVILHQDTKKILLTYFDLRLEEGNNIQIRGTTYTVTKKQFNADARCYELFVKEV